MHFEYRRFFLSELLPSITIRTLALVTADFHSHNQISHDNRKAEQAKRAETTIHQMVMTILGMAYRSSFISESHISFPSNYVIESAG